MIRLRVGTPECETPSTCGFPTAFVSTTSDRWPCQRRREHGFFTATTVIRRLSCSTSYKQSRNCRCWLREILSRASFPRGSLAQPCFPTQWLLELRARWPTPRNSVALRRRKAVRSACTGTLFPVADVNSNPANPIIGTRAFGANPEQVGALVAAYIRGARANGMLTTAKHFPGHGNTGTDSHLAVARVDEDLEVLRTVDLPPFRRAIEAGVDAVMTAHIRVPALDPDPNLVATTSPAIVTNLLKNELGFKGIVVTDALDMAGLTRLYAGNVGRAAVDAFKAGNDVLTMPADLDASYRAVLEAVRTGEISEQRLDASVLKILQAKASLGLHKTRLVDVAAISRLVGSPANVAIGQRISDDSVTLVRDNGKLLPLRHGASVKNAALVHQRGRQDRPLLVIVLCDNVRAEDGRVLEREIRLPYARCAGRLCGPSGRDWRADDVLEAVDQGAGSRGRRVHCALSREIKEGGARREASRVSPRLDECFVREDSRPRQRKDRSSGDGKSISDR